jgi:hypothetical protein
MIFALIQVVTLRGIPAGQRPLVFLTISGVIVSQVTAYCAAVYLSYVLAIPIEHARTVVGGWCDKK